MRSHTHRHQHDSHLFRLCLACVALGRVTCNNHHNNQTSVRLWWRPCGHLPSWIPDANVDCGVARYPSFIKHDMQDLDVFEEVGSASYVLTEQRVGCSLGSHLKAGNFADCLSSAEFETQVYVNPSSFFGTAGSRQRVNLRSASGKIICCTCCGAMASLNLASHTNTCEPSRSTETVGCMETAVGPTRAMCKEETVYCFDVADVVRNLRPCALYILLRSGPRVELVGGMETLTHTHAHTHTHARVGTTPHPHSCTHSIPRTFCTDVSTYTHTDTHTQTHTHTQAHT